MENNNTLIIVAAAVVILVVAAGGAFALGLFNFNSSAQFDESLKSAYAGQGNISDEIFEMETVDYESSSSVAKAIKDVESFQKDNDNSKKHLDTALTQTNNDTEKQYVNLLLEQNKLLDKSLKLWADMLKDFKKYNDGKMDATELYNNVVVDAQSKMSDVTDAMTKNSEEIQDLLSDHPELEERLKTLGIKNSFIGDDGS